MPKVVIAVDLGSIISGYRYFVILCVAPFEVDPEELGVSGTLPKRMSRIEIVGKVSPGVAPV